jgi:predicted ATPase
VTPPMIEQLILRNFKCFERADIRLNALTLLTGLNGMGKSSVIQSLLLIRQSYQSGVLRQGRLSCSDDLVDLGRIQDILFEGAKTETIEIGFIRTGDSELVTFPFALNEKRDTAVVSDERANLAALERLAASPATRILVGEPVYSERPNNCVFHYLTAERHGPRKALPMSRLRSNSGEIGAHGEYVLDVLDTLKGEVILPPADPRHLPGPSLRFGDQVEAWLGNVSPGVRIDLRPVPEADMIVGGFNFGEEGELRSNTYRATNVGFGLSYVLPVLVALLSAPAGSLVLVENPEAHMHPRGQTRLGELCARAAAGGVQVIVETHSDHLLDGARIAIRDGLLGPERATFHYFSRQNGSAQVETPSIDAEGRLSGWPSGFFDQHRLNTAKLVRPRTS